MSNEFYDSSGAPATSSSLSSATIRAEFDLVEAGFGKLPTMAGAGDQMVFINSAATALTSKTASQARTALGLAIGTNVQAWDADLDAFAALGATAGIVVKTGVGAFAVRTLTGTANEITVTNGDGSAAVPTFSLPTALVFTGKTITGGTFAGPTLTTPALGVATATSINKMAITAPASASTLAVADGKTFTASATLTLAGTDGSTLNVGTGGTLGTAAYTASTAYQPVDATLTSIAALGTAANKIAYTTGVDTWAETALGAGGKSLIAGADAAAMLTTLGITVPSAAAQSDQETGTSVVLAVTPGRQQFHPSAAKAWVVYDTRSGAAAITASYNVTSITDNGTGDVTVNFTTAFSSVNYAFCGAASATGAGSNIAVIGDDATFARATGSFRCVWRRIDGNAVDAFYCALVFYGDQ
jgi:hypothetical protein